MNQRKRLLAAAIVGTLVLVWTGAAVALVLLELSLGQWTLIMTAAVLATEAGLWAGAVLLGIAAIRRLRERLRLRAPEGRRS